MKLTTFLNLFEEAVFEGNGWAVTCPGHNDSKPSLRVAVTDDEKLLLKCRAGCSTTDVLEQLGMGYGDLFGIEVDVTNYSKVRQGADVAIAPGDQAKMAGYLASCSTRLTEDPPDGLADYIKRRFGLDFHQAVDLGLGFDPGGLAEDFDLLGQVYRGVPRLVVPFFDFEGVPRGFQGRDLDGTSKVRWGGPSNPPEGGSWTRLAVFRADAGIDYVVVTEGPGDALTAVGAGVDAVGIRGAAMSGGVAEELATHLKGRRIVLAGDADSAGQGFNRKLGQALTEAGLDVYLLTLPEGIGDLTEWHEADPAQFAAEFQRAVATAPPLDLPHPPGAQSSADDDFDPTTDVGVARRVLSYFGGRLIHSPGLGFFIYDGGVWRRDDLKRVRLTVHEVSDELEQRLADFLAARNAQDIEALGGADKATAKKLLRATQRLRSSNVIDNVIKELEAMVNQPHDIFDRHHHLLAFTNGVVDLRSGDLRDHDPDLHLTRRLELPYDPDADCPRWTQFLGEVFPENPEMADYIQRLVGYGVTGETREQCFAVLWGTGANGKSVFTDTLSAVFEPISTTTPFSTFEERSSGGIPNDLAALRGSRLVYASEGERGRPMAEAVIKRVTGQDLITARFMREEFFSFRPTFLIFLATNFKPNFKGQDEGLWRRVKLVPWSRYFAPEERDHFLTLKLKDESIGIAAWAVQGAVEWYRAGLQDPEMVTGATKNYRETADALAGFYPDGPLTKGTRTDFVVGTEAWELYVQWCDDEDLGPKERWTRRTFYNALEERGAEKVKKEVGICLFGIKRAESVVLGNTSTTETDSIFGGSR
jgi:putative DNA primase/helicase